MTIADTQLQHQSLMIIRFAVAVSALLFSLLCCEICRSRCDSVARLELQLYWAVKLRYVVGELFGESEHLLLMRAMILLNAERWSCGVL